MFRPRARKRLLHALRTAVLPLSGVLLLCGCSTPALDAARHEFYRGNLTEAERILDEADPAKTDRVLVLLERGTIRQALGDYEGSSSDLINAADTLQELETYSVSKGAASMVINDSVQDYVGVPYERALAHALTALNHLAIGHWEHAAVEARRIIRFQSDEVRGEYPDDAFVRYVAGYGLQMMDDPSNAALQYRLAAQLAGSVAIDPSGWITALSASQTNVVAPPRQPPAPGTARLTAFILLGRAPSGSEFYEQTVVRHDAPYVEIYHKGRFLGRSHMLSDVPHLATVTAEKEALRRAAKEATRLAIKEGTAQVFEHNDQPVIAALIRIILIGMLENPDLRRWETLPGWIAVATVDCPPDLTEFEALVKTPGGATRQIIHVNEPIMRKGNMLVSIFRDLPRFTPPAP